MYVSSRGRNGSEAAQRADAATSSGVRRIAELIQDRGLDTVTTALGQKRRSAHRLSKREGSDPFRAGSRPINLMTTVLFHQRNNGRMRKKLVRFCQRQLFDIFGQRVDLQIGIRGAWMAKLVTANILEFPKPQWHSDNILVHGAT